MSSCLGGVGTSGGYVAVLLDKDEDGSLVWGQHHLVLSRTVMSPTGVIYEKPLLSCKNTYPVGLQRVPKNPTRPEPRSQTREYSILKKDTISTTISQKNMV